MLQKCTFATYTIGGISVTHYPLLSTCVVNSRCTTNQEVGNYQRCRVVSGCSLVLHPLEPYRCYWKDAECPSQWKEWLGTILPPELLPGCSGDLLRHLLPSVRVYLF